MRLWLAGSALLALLMVATGWRSLPTAPLIALLLFPYLVFPWFLVVMVLGVDPVSGARVDVLADGILSRPVTRYEYLLASWAARVVTVLGVYLVVMVPAVLWVSLARRPVSADPVTVYGTAAALGVGALVLILQVSLGYLFGILLRRPLLAVVVLLFLWYPSGAILHAFSLAEFSTISLSQAMPTLLHTRWRRPSDGTTSTGDAAVQELTRGVAQFMGLLSAGPAPLPAREPGFFEKGHYPGLSVGRVSLGYGIPTLLAVGLAMVCFCRRDL